ncbi:hypothetical protein BDR26DRAFT_870722, partial [Obelidium mucronatum]
MFKWNQLISATPRDSTATASLFSDGGRPSDAAPPASDVADSSPLARDAEIVAAAKQTPTCLLRPAQFFVGACGLLALAFAGFPDPIVSLKAQWEAIKNVNFTEENSNSKWPMTALGALTSEDRHFTHEQLEALTSLSKKISIRLKKIKQPFTITCISYVIFSSRSLEKIVFRADIPLHEFDEPVDYVPDDQRSIVEQTLRGSEEIKEYLKEVNRPGNRSQSFRSYCSETTLVVFISHHKELMEVIAEYKRAVDKLLPGFYNWFEPESLHCTLRCVR